jgi:transaldolase
MTALRRLHTGYGQSPWLDNLTRGYLRDGTLARLVADGIRGVTANPAIFARAIGGSTDYDEQFAELTAAGWSLEDAYWQLVVDDITALTLLRPTFDAGDGFVSVEVAAYRLFRERFAGERWQRLAALGAHPQRPLWASTSTRNPAYPDTRYVDELIGPDTVTTMPEATIAAFTDHGTLARTIDTGVDEAAAAMRRLAAAGVDLDDVGTALEDRGVAAFHASDRQVLAVLAAKADQLSHR